MSFQILEKKLDTHAQFSLVSRIIIVIINFFFLETHVVMRGEGVGPIDQVFFWILGGTKHAGGLIARPCAKGGRTDRGGNE